MRLLVELVLFFLKMRYRLDFLFQFSAGTQSSSGVSTCTFVLVKMRYRLDFLFQFSAGTQGPSGVSACTVVLVKQVNLEPCVLEMRLELVLCLLTLLLVFICTLY